MRWQPGDPIVRRDVWRGRPVVGWGGNVVSDEDDLLVLYMPEGAPLAFPPGDFFGAPHPWSHRDRWHGHGVLQLQRPGELHAVWVFWEGPEREHAAWYVNLQEPFRRTPLGFDTQDLELDLVLTPDGAWEFKDDEELEGWIERGRWTPEEIAAIRAEGARVASELQAGRRWWDDAWAAWEPDPSWPAPVLPERWDALSTPHLWTARLELRPLAEDDLEWYAALRARDGFDRAAAAARHAEALEHWTRHGFGKFAVLLGGEPAGLITLNHAGDGLGGIGTDEIDLGWYTLPHLWGRGIAPEAAGAVVEWARARGIGPLVVYLRPDNGASRRVAQKLRLRRDRDGLARNGDPVEVYRLPP